MVKKKKKSKPSTKKKKKPIKARTSGDLRTADEVAAANTQIDAFLASLAVDQRWLRVRARQQRLDRDTLLGVPVEEFANSYANVLSLDLIRRIATMVKSGSSLNAAARAVGVSLTKLREWITQGIKRPDTLYGTLVVILDRAHALAEVNAVSTLYHGKKGWRSSLAYLEQRAGLLERDLFIAAQEELEREEAGKAQAVLDTDKAALVMALLDVAPPIPEDGADEAEVPDNVVDIKSA